MSKMGKNYGKSGRSQSAGQPRSADRKGMKGVKSVKGSAGATTKSGKITSC